LARSRPPRTAVALSSGALAVVLLFVAALSSTGRGRAQASGFTREERTQLLAGALVRRDLERREGDHTLYGGASWQRIESPIADVWRTVTDPSALTRLVPALDEAEVIEESARERVVLMHHHVGMIEASYYAILRLDAAERTLRFELDPSRPHDVREGRGYLRLTRYRGATIAEWSILVDPGAGILSGLVVPMLRDWLLQPPRCLRDELLGTPSC
jgi:hypothetical protein